MSSLVRELVLGSSVEFTESRGVALEGLKGLHRLFVLDLAT